MLTRTYTGSALRAAVIPGEMLALEPRYLFDAAAATTADVTTDTGTGDTSTTSSDTSTSPADSSQQQTTDFLYAVAAPAAVGDLVPGTQDPITIPENGTSDRPIGTIETLVDPSTVSFTLLGDGSTSTTAYAIDSDTGVITIANTLEQDFETTPSFTLLVQVTDNENPDISGITEVTINLLDRNDSPTIEPINDQNIIADGATQLEVEIFANDQDGDPIDYSLVEGPEGAEIVTEGDSTFFRWTPDEGTSDTTITVRVNDPIRPTLSNATQFDVTIEEPDTSSPAEPPPFTPINDSNNSNATSISSATSTPDSGAEFIADSIDSEPSDTDVEIIRDSVQASEGQDTAQLESDSSGETDEGSTEFLASSEVAAIDADIAEIQRLIDAGKDPTLLTPATAAGISKQLMQEASTPEAQVTEILTILENVTNLIGCGR